MFKDTSEGQTHSFNDGCGEPAHNSPMNQDTKCECGCHTSPSSDANMKENGCDWCYSESEYNPRHPKITPKTEEWEYDDEERAMMKKIYPEKYEMKCKEKETLNYLLKKEETLKLRVEKLN